MAHNQSRQVFLFLNVKDIYVHYSVFQSFHLYISVKIFLFEMYLIN